MKLDLTIEEINVIMQALGNAPYAQVAALVQKIREQVLPPREGPQENAQ